MRTIYRTLEFETFYDSLSVNVKEKIKYALNIISEIKVVHTKLVKKLINTEFYELRISGQIQRASAKLRKMIEERFLWRRKIKF